MKKSSVDYMMVVIGILLAGFGLYLVKAVESPEGIMLALPYVCIGIGCGIFGHGMGNSVTNRVMDKNPERKEQLEIEKNDERNITIGNQAKAKAFDMMTFVFGALMLCFALMNVELVAILLLVFAYLFVQGYGIYYRYKCDKEM